MADVYDASSGIADEATPPSDAASPATVLAIRGLWNLLTCCSISALRADDTVGHSSRRPRHWAAVHYIRQYTGRLFGAADPDHVPPFPQGYERVPLVPSETDTVTNSDDVHHGYLVGAGRGTTRLAVLPAPTQTPSLHYIAAQLQALSRLSAIGVALEISSDGSAMLRIHGPVRCAYTLDDDGPVMTTVQARATLPSYLFDANGCPLTPVAAMDAAEDLIAELLRPSGGAGPVRGATLDALTLGWSPSGVRIATQESADDDLVNHQRQAKYRKGQGLGLSDHLAVVSEQFCLDYAPRDVQQRVQHFVLAVLEAVAACNVSFDQLRLYRVAFHEPGNFAELLTAPWVPQATREGSPGGLKCLEIEHCTIGPPHINALLRQLKSVTRRRSSQTPNNVFHSVRRFVLSSHVDEHTLQALLGFIADTAVSDAGTPSLQHLVVDEALLPVVLRHRIATSLETLNGRPVKSASSLGFDPY